MTLRSLCFFLLVGVHCVVAQEPTTSNAQFIDALSDTFHFESSSRTSENFADYFQSESFKSDAKSGRWDLGISAVADGNPINLAANSNEQQRAEFSAKLKAYKTVQISADTKIKIVRRYASQIAWENFVRLAEIEASKVGFNAAVTSEEDFVLVTLSYRKESGKEPWPTLKRIHVIGGFVVDAPAPETVLDAPYTVKIRRQGDEDVVFAMDTDLKRPVVLRAQAPISRRFARGIPIGSVIASTLPFDKFLQAVGEKAPYDSRRSNWAPADGRAVASQDYTALASTSNVPDLRGVFVRGLNVFDPGYSATNPLGAAQADPDGDRRVGGLQADTVGPHSHPITTLGSWVAVHAGGTHGVANHYWFGQNGSATQNNVGTTETRPKNVALFYYIRIR